MRKIQKQKQMRFDVFGIPLIFHRCRQCGDISFTHEYGWEFRHLIGCHRCFHDDFEIITEDEYERIMADLPCESDIPY